MERVALIVASGSGSRFNSNTPKQFTKIKEKTVIEHTLEKFYSHFEKIVVVIDPEYSNHINTTNQVEICFGGVTRQHSVLNGLKYLSQYNPKIVAIHDAARLLVSEKMIIESIQTAQKYQSAIPVLPVTDSLWYIDDQDKLTHTANRIELAYSQTPQVFSFDKILEAHMQAELNLDKFSDCAGVYSSMFGSLSTYSGEKTNIKLTTQADLKLIDCLLSNQ